MLWGIRIKPMYVPRIFIAFELVSATHDDSVAKTQMDISKTKQKIHKHERYSLKAVEHVHNFSLQLSKIETVDAKLPHHNIISSLWKKKKTNNLLWVHKPCGNRFSLRVLTSAPSGRGRHGNHSANTQSSRITHTRAVPICASVGPQYLRWTFVLAHIVKIKHNRDLASLSLRVWTR